MQMNIRKKLVVPALALALAMPAPASRADTPFALEVAALGAAAVVSAAAIGALAEVLSAKISADAEVESAKITAGGETKTTTKDKNSKKTTAPSTSQSISAGDAGGFLPIGPMPKTLREFILQRSGKIGGTNVPYGGDTQLALSTEYTFEGDVLSAPDNVESFQHTDTVTYDLVVSDKSANGKTTIAYVFKELKLSTKDIPGSVGFSQITVRSQSGKLKTTWRARVDQGKKPKYDKIFAASGSIKASNDNLAFTGPAVIPIPVELGADKKGRVRITVTYRGSGKRT